VKHTIVRMITYLSVTVVGVCCVFPFIWMISTSLKDTVALFIMPPQIIPKSPTIANYVELFTATDFFIWLRTSTIVSVFAILSDLFTSSLAGYVFAKKTFPGKNFLFVCVLSTIMIPFHVLLVPVFRMFSRLNLINTFPGLIFPWAVSALSVFIMRQYIGTIPDELLDSAKIDGCAELRILFSIVVPLCKPALSALAIFAFLNSWNNFLWPLILTTSGSMRTLPLGIALFQTEYTTRWGMLMAAATMQFIPILVFFIVLQRYFVQGITLTGLKV
jgi:multiple sugar transport system permease protein